MKRIFIIAGDSSGDLHASKVMKELRKLIPEIEFFGIGGDKMSEQGLSSIVPLHEISVVGFWEVAKKYTYFKNLIEVVKKTIIDLKIDLFLPIDFPGFNQRIAKFAKEKSIPVVWYIAPQLWVWGEKRAVNLAKIIDDLLVVFPFEKEFFERFKISTHFVGHPLLDIPEFGKEQILNKSESNKILMMPGSRMQEIKSHLPLMLALQKMINTELIDFKTVIAIPKNLIGSVQGEVSNNNLEFSFDSKNEMLSSRAGIIKTGTSNLEACLAGLPFLMFYRTSPLTYLLGKNLIKVEYLSLVNILSHKTVINELIQRDATPTLIFRELEKLLFDKSYIQKMLESFNEIRDYLGESGASGRVAEFIFNKYLNK